ncbi:MAG: Fe-S cluster assembly protein SufD [Bacteroidota bacterium]
MNTVAQDRFATTKAHFKQLFEQFEQGLNGQKAHPIHKLRRTAIQRLEDLQFPGRKNEDWKYTPVTRVLQPAYKSAALANLTSADVEAHLFEGLDVHLLVFNNGKLDQTLSNIGELPEGVEISTIATALDKGTHKEKIEGVLKGWAEGKDAFAALNMSFADNGLFIYVPANVQVEKPIYLLHLNLTASSPFLNNPQRIILAERSSNCTIIERYSNENSNGTYFTNAMTHIDLGANAFFTHYKLQQESLESFQVNQVDVLQERDSTYTSHAIDLGGRLVRNNLRTHLKNSGTLTNFYGVYLAKGEQHLDNQTFIDHAFPHCNSNELYKGVIDDKARGVFNGKVIVRQDAQKTNAFQQNSNLVLSDKAVMDTKPQLEIFADDVKCSHGATIGQLDEESIFYLRSRGLNKEAARSLLQQAFLKEVIENMDIEPIREVVESMITKKFES